MHPGSFMYVGFGGPTGTIKFPKAFIDAIEDSRVLTPEGDPLEFELDQSGKKFFRQIREDFDCYGFEIAQFDTMDEVNLKEINQVVMKWMPWAEKIGRRYRFRCKPKLYILSDIV